MFTNFIFINCDFIVIHDLFLDASHELTAHFAAGLHYSSWLFNPHFGRMLLAFIVFKLCLLNCVQLTSPENSFGELGQGDGAPG